MVKLAWRNLWRNKRRTLICVSAVVFAVMLTIAMRGIQLGTYDANIRNAVGLFAGHLQVQRTGYLDNPSLRKSFRYNDDIRRLLDNQSAIRGYGPRINGDGLTSFGENAMGSLVFGMSPQDEAGISTLMSRVTEGEPLSRSDGDDVVIGHKLLRNLGAGIGDTVVVLAQGFDGSLGNLKFRIAGSLKTGAPELDRSAVFMGLETAQELLAMEGRINAVAIALNGLDQVDRVRDDLNRAFTDPELTALSWVEIMPELQQAIELDNISGLIFFWILIIVVAFGILNTILMSVTERFREFGVSLAIGMHNRKLVMQILLESLAIAMLGIVVGNLLALGINAYIVANPIAIGGDLAVMYEEFGFIPSIQSTLRADIFVNSSLNLLIVSLLSALYPAYRAYRLEPLKGIRYT